MKKIIYLVGFLFALTFTQANAQEASFFGEKITEKGAIEASKLSAKMKDKKSMETKVIGTVIEVCKKKGCWMTLDIGNKQTMRVTFKDYAFFVPKDCNGKQIIVEGVAQKEITDVAALKHYAEDAGQSKEEIAKINKPKEEYTFEAKGVILKNK
ncbi:MAG: DUF4920 domain-containing protein [Cytophagales bacterium]|nr:MAG: DUF4920 domain-containing protein [Cytophagales bacterium]